MKELRPEVQHRMNVLYSSFLSQEEPKKVEDALQDPNWVIAMQEELNQFERNEVRKLVPRPKNRIVICTKWVFRNKMDETGVVSRNKARLVCQGLLSGGRN